MIPVGVTVSFLTDEGTEVVFRIAGSHKWVAERLAFIGGQALLVIPLIEPGTERRFDYTQGSTDN